MKAPGMFLLALTGVPLALSPSALAADDRLEAPQAVDWRGLPLRQVLDQLSQATKTPYLVDNEVPSDAMNRPVRLFAAHLTARQAFRWAARLAGFEAVVREDLVLIAPPRKLPRVWRLTGGALAEPPGWRERLGALAKQRANITWIDTPMSGVARDISGKFVIDAIFHPAILSEEPLIHLEMSEASLEMLRTAIEEQLKAQTAIMDGALWVVPSTVELDDLTTRPSAEAPNELSESPPAKAAGPLDQFVILDHSVQSWKDFCDRLSRAGGVTCRAVSPESAFPARLEARGALGEVLESARLLGRLTWRFVPGGGGRPSALEIRPGSEKR